MRRLFSTFGHGSPGAGSCRCARLPVSVLSSMASWYCALNRRWYPRYCTPSRPVLECPPFRVGELTRHGTTAAAAPSRAAGTIGVEPTAFSGARSVHACARVCTHQHSAGYVVARGVRLSVENLWTGRRIGGADIELLGEAVAARA